MEALAQGLQCELQHIVALELALGQSPLDVDRLELDVVLLATVVSQTGVGVAHQVRPLDCRVCAHKSTQKLKSSYAMYMNDTVELVLPSGDEHMYTLIAFGS